MKTGESLLSIGKFIAEYSAHLMGAGVHTSRVVRNTKRIGEAFGLDVKLSVFQIGRASCRERVSTRV